jgi:hypothetical protein
MAIKGKKKQQSRGSQARRRPAMAPRAAYNRSAHVPWYRTAGGRVAAAIVVVLLIAAVGGTVAAISSNNSEDRDQQIAVEDYTDRVRNTLTALSQPVSSLAAFPPNPTEQELKQLPDAVARWKTALREVQSGSGELKPPPELKNVNILFVESIIGYLSAVDELNAVTRVEGDSRKDRIVRELLLRNAADDRNRATAVWSTGVALLDEARARLDLEASNITNPLVGPPAG